MEPYQKFIQNSKFMLFKKKKKTICAFKGPIINLFQTVIRY